MCCMCAFCYREERNQCFSCPLARAGSSPDQRVLQLFPHQLHGCLWSRIKRCCSGNTQDYMNATRKTDSATFFAFVKIMIFLCSHGHCFVYLATLVCKRCTKSSKKSLSLLSSSVSVLHFSKMWSVDVLRMANSQRVLG